MGANLCHARPELRANVVADMAENAVLEYPQKQLTTQRTVGKRSEKNELGSETDDLDARREEKKRDDALVNSQS